MRTFSCQCGNRLFFDNFQCLSCGCTVGRCPACREVVPLEADGDVSRCGNPQCGVALELCGNSSNNGICNWFVQPGSDTPEQPLCRSCRLTRVIPDLSVEGNRSKWADLEAAKRRVLQQLDRIGLPHGETTDPPLAFEFKADAGYSPDDGNWRSSGAGVVQTGHANGVITINLAEADAVEREAIRVRFGEDHRTLVGHLRHEIAHYFWDTRIRGRQERDFVEVFGNHRQPTYSQAMQRHYDQGPPADWPSRFVSAYASMHPWEDFAETFAKYLEMRAVLDTASHFGLVEVANSDDAAAAALIRDYESVGLVTNELNRDLGLADLDPRPIVDAVQPKIGFVHELVRNAAAIPA